MTTAKKHTTIDAYIADFPKDVQEVLEQVRETIKEAAPGVEEKISYAIPAFALNKLTSFILQAIKTMSACILHQQEMYYLKKTLQDIKQEKDQFSFLLKSLCRWI